LFSVSQIDEAIVVDTEEVDVINVKEVAIPERSCGSATQKPGCLPMQVSTRHRYERSCSPSYSMHAKWEGQPEYLTAKFSTQQLEAE
jgi:hypothetical protein